MNKYNFAYGDLYEVSAYFGFYLTVEEMNEFQNMLTRFEQKRVK